MIIKNQRPNNKTVLYRRDEWKIYTLKVIGDNHGYRCLWLMEMSLTTKITVFYRFMFHSSAFIIIINHSIALYAIAYDVYKGY